MPMRRKDREMNYEESVLFLREANFGILSMSHNNQPYAIPLNHYLEENTLYFHAALVGKKLDVIAENPSVCFVVAEYSGLKASTTGFLCNFGAYYRSVLCTGKARLISDAQEKAEIVTKLTRHLTKTMAGNAADVTPEQAGNISIIAMDILEISGKACLPG